MTVGELIEKLMTYPLDATVTVFYDLDHEQGEEAPVVITDGNCVIIAAESDARIARHWIGR